ncbi:protein ydgH [Klebsiella pneumoniae subsp. pneumoniae]|nr:protein ydgH [Klebsiella pneumoniae subsp. pneumoniae]
MLQSPDAIPADSEAGRAALAKGGEAAKNVEIPGVATTAAVGSGTGVGRFFETQSSKGGRYTVTLPNGTKVEEVNKVTAAQMVPFDNIQFTGNYGNMTEISYQTAKRAAKKGAKYYHITRQWQERGGNITISGRFVQIIAAGWLKRRRIAAFSFFFIPRHCMAPGHSVKIPRLSAILHFYAISQNKYSGTAIFTSGMQWKRNWA